MFRSELRLKGVRLRPTCLLIVGLGSCRRLSGRFVASLPVLLPTFIEMEIKGRFKKLHQPVTVSDPYRNFCDYYIYIFYDIFNV